MDLPAELRIKVYEIALEDYIDEILAPTYSHRRPNYHGALGLLMTSKTQRLESAHAMLPLATAEYDRREADFNRAERQGAGLSYLFAGHQTAARLEARRVFYNGYATYFLKWMPQLALLIDSPSCLYDQQWDLLWECPI